MRPPRPRASNRTRLRVALLAVLLVGFVRVPAGLGATRVYRAFEPSSYWNTPLPANAPVDPSSEGIIGFLRSDNTGDYLSLSGTDAPGLWGNPIYWSTPTDTTYAIKNTCSSKAPPEFSSVRIPDAAEADPTSDAAMTVYDLIRGLVYGLWQAHYDAPTDTWSACGGTVYYLDSNGLAGVLTDSNESRNQGHRGLPPSTFAVRFDELLAGTIPHVLKIAVNTTKCSHVFPMTGDECGTYAEDAPPEGARIRIKPTVDLDGMRLSPPARVVAAALQRYGAVIGDQSDDKAELKVENTVAEGRGWLWEGVLQEDSLAAIPLDDYQVIKLGYGEGDGTAPVWPGGRPPCDRLGWLEAMAAPPASPSTRFALA